MSISGFLQLNCERQLTRVFGVPSNVLDRASVTVQEANALLCLHVPQPDALVSACGGLDNQYSAVIHTYRAQQRRRLTSSVSSWLHAKSKMAF